VWHIILDAELYTTCPGERVLVATRFNVTFLPLMNGFCLPVDRTEHARFEKLVTTAHDPEILKYPFVDSLCLTVPLS